jgi:hypothetical protein
MKKLDFDHQFYKTFTFDGAKKWVSVLEVQEHFDLWYRENIESAPLVQGWFPGTYPNGTWTSSEVIHNISTHTARLIDIQEIKKECANHEPMSFEAYTIDGKYICRHCSVELIPEWRAKP